MPPFMGVVIGYEGLHNHCVEGGVVFHMLDVYNDKLPVGNMVGFTLTYKHSLTNPLNTIEAEAGIYSPVCLGFGLSENFYSGTHTIGFRPFLGTAWFHLQILAGYNFYSKKRNDYAELDNFTVKIRYVIPIVRTYRNYVVNPGNNY
jgi:hypothetical protein